MALSVPCETQARLIHKAYLFLANLWIFFVFISWTLIFLPWGLSIVLLAKLCPIPRGTHFMRQAIYYYGRVMWLLLKPVMPINIHNAAEAYKHTPCVIIANHQSFLDLFLFGAQHSPNFVFLSKTWPYKKLFFFAPMMRYAEYIDVETNSPEEIEEKCAKLLKENVSVVIFPEGMRTRDGKLGRFHVGAFQLACKLNVTVVPFVLENSGAVFAVGAKYFTPQTIHLAMLDPIMPNDFAHETLPHRAMMRAAREKYIEHFNSKTEVQDA